MDENKRSANGNISKRHFSKLHDRIQNKYAQMQKRLEKSRSMESISSLNEEFATKKSSLDAKDDEERDLKRDENYVKHSVIVEDVNKQDAVEDLVEIMIYESIINKEKDHDVFIGHSLSLENVHEESGNELVEFIEDTLPSSSSKRVTVGERISAAMERRRERNREKLKKHEPIGIDSPDKIILSNKPLDASKRRKVASVAVALVEASGLENELAVDEKARQLYCRIRLGPEKYKSKAAKINDNLASWQELFNFNLCEDYFLEITMWEKEKDAYVGRAVVDLNQLKHNKTHKIELRLEGVPDAPVELLLLVTVSGAVKDNTADQNDGEIKQNEIIEIQKHISWALLNDEYDHVGILHVTVYQAEGLSAMDCFAVFMLGNDRCQTHTEHKTYSPHWMQEFSFEVKDVTSILYVTIHDEKKSDIVGKLALPLLRIVNKQQKWYALKDETLRKRAKGRNPRILLEMSLQFHFMKQAIRLINPKEKMYLEEEKAFNRHVLSRNIHRMKIIVNWITETIKVTKQLFEWENMVLNVVALTGWILFWYFFEAWMLPLLMLIPFYWYRPEEYHFTSWTPDVVLELLTPTKLTRSESRSSITSLTTTSSTTTITPEKPSKTSFRQKLYSVAEMVTTVQNGIGNAASLGEGVKNLFNFTVPFISFFAIGGILGGSVVLYYMDARYLFIIWGIHKFLRKILRPNRIPNNEILDLLSRVPDDDVLRDCEEIPLLKEEELPPLRPDKKIIDILRTK